MSTAEDQQPPCFLTIGYALAPKKQQSFIQPSLLAVAAAHGLRLVPIDPTLPLSSQGPFHLILHKLSSPQWTSDLALFSALHPFVPIIDPPDAIEVTHDRVSMLKVVHDLAAAAAQGHHCTFGVPSQVVVHEPAELADAGVVAGLRFPVIAKPLVADGSARSHEMALVFNRDGLLKQKPPLVLQEFVNHGGVIFKVYVVGDYVKCVKRKSLPDISDEKLSECSEGSLPFSQISNLTAPERAKEYHETEQLAEAEMPLTSFVTELANGLRHAMGLHLFNFDMIRDVRVGNHYLVIDINYFPGYAKMPSYETVLTDFFLSIIREKQKEDGSDSVLGAVDDRGKCCIREDIDNVG